MKKILSVLLTLCMLMACLPCAVAEAPVESGSLTISNIVLSLGDETYALEPSLRLEAGMIDEKTVEVNAAVLSGDEELLPLRAQLSEGEIIVALSDMTRAYTVKPEMTYTLNGESSEAAAHLAEAAQAVQGDEQLAARVAEVNTAIFAAEASSETETYMLGDEERSGYIASVERNAADILGLLDELATAVSGEFHGALMECVNETMQKDDPDFPELANLVDLAAMLEANGVDISVCVTGHVDAEDEKMGDRNAVLRLSNGEETMEFQLFSVQLFGENGYVLTSSIGREFADVTIDLSLVSNKEGMVLDLSSSNGMLKGNVTRTADVIDISLDADLAPEGRAKVNFSGMEDKGAGSFALEMDAGSVLVEANYATAEGVTAGHVKFNVYLNDVEQNVSVEFDFTACAEPIASIPAEAEKLELNEENYMLPLTAAMADVNTLRQESSVEALINGIMSGSVSEPVDPEVTEEPADNGEEGTMVFNNLPEYLELQDEPYVYESDYYNSAAYTFSGVDENSEYRSVNFSFGYTEGTELVGAFDLDGNELEGSVVTVSASGYGVTYSLMCPDGVQLDVTDYSETPYSIEEILGMIAGIER